MITEDFVTHEVARLLEKKGFDSESITAYYFFMEGSEPILNRIEPQHFINQCGGNISLVGCPTLQMACKWLRLNHHLYVHVVVYCDQESGPYWNWFIDNTETGQTVGENTSLIQCDSPEEAYNDGIKYCLEKLI